MVLQDKCENKMTYSKDKKKMYEISVTYCYNTKQYDLNDCVVKVSNTKSFAKTSKGEKKR